MPYVGSYLWRLRQAVGSELVLMPGAMVVLRRDDGQVLLTRRADDGSWCLPAGAAEVGGSFARTAIEELAEEAGVEVLESDLVPFGCLSEAEAHTIHYPNGDVTTASRCSSWRPPGGETPAPATTRRRMRGSLIRQRPPSCSIPRPLMPLSSCGATSRLASSNSAKCRIRCA